MSHYFMLQQIREQCFGMGPKCILKRHRLLPFSCDDWPRGYSRGRAGIQTILVHARKDAAVYNPPFNEKRDYKDVDASSICIHCSADKAPIRQYVSRQKNYQWPESFAGNDYGKLNTRGNVPNSWVIKQALGRRFSPQVIDWKLRLLTVSS